MKILISDKLAQEGIDILTAVKGFQVDTRYALTPEQLKKIIKDYNALIVRSSTKVTADIIEAADQLKVIGRAGVGMDNVDLKAATKKGIVAMNTPAGNTTSTAEHTMSLILSLARNIPQASASVKAGKWERSKFNGIELHGKTLGIIGLGRIGSTVARMAKGCAMNIVAYDPYLSKEVAQQFGVKLIEFDDLLQVSDFISIHIPKETEQKYLISHKEFQKMKKGVRIINCARGGIIDERALVEALDQGLIAGFALDVYEQEPLPSNSPLLKFEHCVTTPHLGASTSEAQINVAIEIAEVVRDALLGKGIRNAVNFPSVSAEAFKVLEPYISLAQRMGKFAGQLILGRMNEVKATYSGVVTKYKVEPVTMSLMNGLLAPVLGESVNTINAVDLAKERGINIEVIQSTREEEFVNLINVDIHTDQEEFTIWGTLSANNQPRIVKINNVYVETMPEGYMLFINNNDKPGIVGAIGTILAKGNINIASITLGRAKQGGRAISVVNVDSKVPEEIIENLQKTKDILFVKLIKV